MWDVQCNACSMYPPLTHAFCKQALASILVRLRVDRIR
jgi:hypothetical protein